MMSPMNHDEIVSSVRGVAEQARLVAANVVA